MCALTTRSARAAQYISAKFRGDNFSGKLSGSGAGSACLMAQKQHSYHMLMIMTASQVLKIRKRSVTSAAKFKSQREKFLKMH